LGISKRGDKNLRRLLVQGHQSGILARWVSSMLTRRHSNVVACALANKLARIAWAIAAHHTAFETKEAPTPTAA
jgi:transposase